MKFQTSSIANHIAKGDVTHHLIESSSSLSYSLFGEDSCSGVVSINFFSCFLWPMLLLFYKERRRREKVVGQKKRKKRKTIADAIVAAIDQSCLRIEQLRGF